jgi:hypothetical protein
MKRYDNNLDGILDESVDGEFIYHSDHLAAIRELTDRLAQVEKERDELKRGKSCADCRYEHYERDMEPCFYCTRGDRSDNFVVCDMSIDEWDYERNKPRDPSAEQGDKHG